MKRLWLLCAPAGFLLSSATPPPLGSNIALESEAVLDAYPLCPEGVDCTELAGWEGGQAGDGELADPVPVGEAAPLAAAEPVAPPPAKDNPSDFANADDRAPEDRRILVSIPQQKAYVFQGGELLATSPVSTGKRGHETPTGTFRILQKKVHHRSNRYANAPMPYMQRLTSYGIALHAGSLPGYPASHGCIRLPRHFAKKLYQLTDMGTRVTITRRRPKSADDALTLV